MPGDQPAHRIFQRKEPPQRVVICYDCEWATMQIRVKLGDRPHKGEAFCFGDRVAALWGGKRMAGIGSNTLKSSLSLRQDSPITYPLATVRTSVGA